MTTKVRSEEELNELTCAELRQICKSRGINGVSKTNKSDLIEILMSSFDEEIDDDDSYTTDEDETETPISHITANLYSFQDKDSTYKTLITVSCGAASSNYPVVGKTVAFVKAVYREILNIETGSESILNGEKVEDSYILKSGDILEFVRNAGRKG